MKKELFEDISKAFKTGFFHIFGGNVINKIISFLSGIVLVRILTKAEYGTFTYAWNLYSFIILFNGLGMSSGALQVGSEKWNQKDCNNVFSYAVKKGTFFDILLAIAIVAMCFVYPFKIKNADKLLLSLCMLPLPQFLFDIDTVYLRIKRRNDEYSKASVLSTFLIFVFSVIGAFIFREFGLIIGRYASYILSIIFCVLAFGVKFGKDSSLPKSEKKLISNISYISLANNSISQLLYLLDIFVLGIVTANEEILASYKIATTIPTALLFIPSSLVTYIYPYFANHCNDREWCYKHYKKVFIINFLFSLLITIILFAFAPFIIRIVFGKNYLDAVPAFRILVVSFLFSSSFRIVSSNLLVTMKKLKFNLIEALISGGVNVIADYYLIKFLGSIGAAVATLAVVIISSLLSTVYLIYVYKKAERGENLHV